MLKFTKMHGLGNDYIIINSFNNENTISYEKLPSFSRFICNRHFGVGADGIILIEKSNSSDFKMRIYNQDGSIAQMCGNGIRCLSKYVYEYGLTKKKSFNIETDAGIKRTYLKTERKSVEEITICMGTPIFELCQLEEAGFINKTPNNKILIKIDEQEFNVLPVSIGNPHAVIFVNSVDKFDIQKYGQLIEKNEMFPQRTNVEFVQVVDKGHLKIRVWERGVGETYACGTGACASLAMCAYKGYTRRSATVNLKGGDLYVNWSLQDNKIYLTGIATKVFDGLVEW